MPETLLKVNGLSISFSQYTGAFARGELAAIRDVSLDIRRGEMVGVVGASGSGKSLLAHGIMGILPYNAQMGGEVFYKRERLTPARLSKLRGREIVLVPQSVSYLDPLMRVEAQVEGGRRQAGQARAALSRYGLGREVGRMYPFELSGGMARRVMIATAAVESPELVIADEPTPGLHIEAARRVLSHFREMADGGAGVLLITHDLELALKVCDRICVLYAGTAIEDAPAGDFSHFSALRHPYTQALWRAMPQNGFALVEGAQPYGGAPGQGCPYFQSCPIRGEECLAPIPYIRVGEGYVRCIRCKRGEGP